MYIRMENHDHPDVYHHRYKVLPKHLSALRANTRLESSRPLQTPGYSGLARPSWHFEGGMSG
jgi:hypothetical protein